MKDNEFDEAVIAFLHAVDTYLPGDNAVVDQRKLGFKVRVIRGTGGLSVDVFRSND